MFGKHTLEKVSISYISGRPGDGQGRPAAMQQPGGGWRAAGDAYLSNAVRCRTPERKRAYFGWPKMPEGLSNIEVSSKNYFPAAIPK